MTHVCCSLDQNNPSYIYIFQGEYIFLHYDRATCKQLEEKGCSFKSLLNVVSVSYWFLLFWVPWLSFSKSKPHIWRWDSSKACIKSLRACYFLNSVPNNKTLFYMTFLKKRNLTLVMVSEGDLDSHPPRLKLSRLTRPDQLKLPHKALLTCMYKWTNVNFIYLYFKYRHKLLKMPFSSCR